MNQTWYRVVLVFCILLLALRDDKHTGIILLILWIDEGFGLALVASVHVALRHVEIWWCCIHQSRHTSSQAGSGLGISGMQLGGGSTSQYSRLSYHLQAAFWPGTQLRYSTDCKSHWMCSWGAFTCRGSAAFRPDDLNLNLTHHHCPTGLTSAHCSQHVLS